MREEWQNAPFSPFLVKLGDIKTILLVMGMMLVWWRYGSSFRYAFLQDYSNLFVLFYGFNSFTCKFVAYADCPTLVLWEISAAHLCNYQMLFPNTIVHMCTCRLKVSLSLTLGFLLRYKNPLSSDNVKCLCYSIYSEPW